MSLHSAIASRIFCTVLWSVSGPCKNLMQSHIMAMMQISLKQLLSSDPIIYFNMKLFSLSQFCLVKETFSTTINFSHWNNCFESKWREIWCTPAITPNNVLSGVLCQLQEFIWRKYLHMKEVHLVAYYTITPRGHLMSTIFSHLIGLCTVQMSYPLAIY